MDVQALGNTGTACVSVLLAAYRSGETLPEAIHSVLIQDWPNIELIVCDDGTEDFDEGAVTQQVNAENKGNCTCQILHHVHNLGTVKNLNTGLKQAHGHWVLLLAGDDALAEETVLSQLCRVAQGTKSNWLLSKTMLCDQALRPSGVECPEDNEWAMLCKADPLTIWAQLCHHCFIPSSGILYRREFLIELGGFDEAYRLTEDWPLFLKAIRCGYVPQTCDLISVLHRAGGVSRNHAGKNERYQTDLIAVIQREILPQIDCLPKKRQKSMLVHCKDKIFVYQMRYEYLKKSPWEKILFVAGNGFGVPLVMRKIMGKWNYR